MSQPAYKPVESHGAPHAPGAKTAHVLPPFGRSAAAQGITGDFVRGICELRRSREQSLPRKLLTDSSWDVLLRLYAAHLESHRLSITRLTRLCRLPATTVLRRLSVLEAEGMITRSLDPYDGRRVYVALTLRGAEAMDACFAASGERAVFI